jgi:hypothetical protein
VTAPKESAHRAKLADNAALRQLSDIPYLLAAMPEHLIFRCNLNSIYKYFEVLFSDGYKALGELF